MNEDREGRPFVGRAGGLLVNLLGHIGWRRDDVFITNIVKCRPPGNRDPEPDEIAACAPYLRRQLEALDPAVVVTLGRYSMGRFMPGARITPGPRHDPHRRSGDGRPRRHGVRDVPPGGRPADARHRAGELRGRGADPGRADRGPGSPRGASPSGTRRGSAGRAGRRRRDRRRHAGDRRHRDREPVRHRPAPIPAPPTTPRAPPRPTPTPRPTNSVSSDLNTGNQ